MTTIVVKSRAKRLGEEIRRARRKSRLTQDELCQKIGISRNSIGHYERGERSPDFDVLQKIAHAVSANRFEVDDGVHIVFSENFGPNMISAPPQQMLLDFDDNGAVTLRIEPRKTGLLIRSASA